MNEEEKELKEAQEPAEETELPDRDRQDFRIIKIGESSDGSSVNKFDMFWLKVWAFLCAVVSAIAGVINKLIKLIFRKKAPDKYVKAVVAFVLIIIGIAIVSAPFNITINKTETLETYADGLIAVEMNIGTDKETNKPVYKWGYADKNGKLKINCVFDEAMAFKHGVAWVRKVEVTEEGVVKNYWMLINKKGKQVGTLTVAQNSVAPAVGNFADEIKLARVCVGGKYGFVDTRGRTVIRFDYDDAGGFDCKIARVRLGNEQFFINRKGKKVSGSYESARDFSDDLAAVKNNGKWGFINSSGNEVVNVQYDEVSDFKKGYALVKSGSSYGIIDAKGNQTVNTGQFTDLEIREFFDQKD